MREIERVKRKHYSDERLYEREGYNSDERERNDEREREREREMMREREREK